MPTRDELAAMAKEILEESSLALSYPHPFDHWRRWSGTDRPHQLTQYLADELGIDINLVPVSAIESATAVVEEVIETYGKALDPKLLEALGRLLGSLQFTFKEQLPATIVPFCAFSLALNAVGAEIAEDQQISFFRNVLGDFIELEYLLHRDAIDSLPVINDLVQVVRNAIFYSRMVLGPRRRILNSWTGATLGIVDGGFEWHGAGIQWNIYAIDIAEQPNVTAYGIENTFLDHVENRFLAVAADSGQLMFVDEDDPAARWSIDFVSELARIHGHALLRHNTTGLCLTREAASSTVVTRIVDPAEYSTVPAEGTLFTVQFAAPNFPH